MIFHKVVGHFVGQ